MIAVNEGSFLQAMPYESDSLSPSLEEPACHLLLQEVVAQVFYWVACSATPFSLRNINDFKVFCFKSVYFFS